MKFNTAEEMLQTIINGADLYSPSSSIYVFVYNDCDSICTYMITEAEAKNLRSKQDTYGGDWSGFLGFGGTIIDSNKYLFENGIAVDTGNDNPTLKWCEEMLHIADWEFV